MALGATIYRAQIELCDVERNCYETLCVTVAKHPSETLERMVGRLLAYCLEYEEGLVFGRGLSIPEDAEIWRRTPDGRIDLWVEVGIPDADRLTWASRQSERLRLYAFAPEGAMRPWKKAISPRVGAIANLEVLELAQSFLAQVAADADRNLRWRLTRTEGELFLDDGKTSRSSLLLTWSPD